MFIRTIRVILAFLISTGLILSHINGSQASDTEYYLVIVKNRQRLYLARGNPDSPLWSDVIKEIPVTTGALWTQKGLETPSGYFKVIEKSNRPNQGGYDFSDTGDVVLTPYFMRLAIPNRGGIGIHTYKGYTLKIWRFGVPGGESTHGCIAGPPKDIQDLYKNYVIPGKTRVWIVDDASEAFKDIKPPEPAKVTVVNNKTWEIVESPTNEQFYAIDMLSDDLGWAVSGDAYYNPRTNKYGWRSHIWKWDGSKWTLEQTIPYWIHSIYMYSPDEGWAVGQNYMGGFHYDGTKWTRVDRPIPRVPYMSDVDIISPDNAWMVGGGGEIFHWNGRGWKVDVEPDIMKTLRAVSILPDGIGWAVGGGWDTVTKETIPMVARFVNGDWKAVDVPIKELFYGVDTLSDDVAWAVGSGGAIIHWDGHEWKQVSSPTKDRLSDVVMLSSNNGWAVGDEKGVALHWDGRSWYKVKLPLNEKFYELDALPSGTVWAVGSHGSIIRLTDVGKSSGSKNIARNPSSSDEGPSKDKEVADNNSAESPKPSPEPTQITSNDGKSSGNSSDTGIEAQDGNFSKITPTPPSSDSDSDQASSTVSSGSGLPVMPVVATGGLLIALVVGLILRRLL